MDYFMALPELGLSRGDILKTLDAYLNLGEYKWKDGRVSGAVYNFDADLCDLVGTVYQQTSYTNPLHSDVFPGINKMEAEVVRMCATMFNGNEAVVGTVRRLWGVLSGETIARCIRISSNIGIVNYLLR